MDATMDAKLDSTDMNEKMSDGSDVKPKPHDSLTIASKLPILPDNSMAGPTGSLTEVTSLSEQISTDDTELASPDKSVNVLTEETGGVTRAVSICGPLSVEQQPRPLCALLPSSTETCTAYETSQSFTAISRKQKKLKIRARHKEPDGDDLCAAILLACLFCHPLDCLLAQMRGCDECVRMLCSSLCCCKPSSLRPLLDVTHCDVCDCLGVGCCLCECPVGDVCLQATECLDLCMEISQMLYH